MTGIYKFENKINHKVYIGLSRNLESRYNQHRRNHTNKNSSQYNTIFYKALRDYGFDSFSYEILEIVEDKISDADLGHLEQEYIQKYDSYNKGYNMNEGGNYTSSDKKLDKETVLSIIEMIKTTDKNFQEIADIYNVNETLISQINAGKVWSRIGNIQYPVRQNTYNHNMGGKNPNATINDKKAMSLRESFVNKTLEQIYEENKDLISYSEMKKILYGVQFQHLPIYKKREKKWYYKGTCIDYPRIEE